MNKNEWDNSLLEHFAPKKGGLSLDLLMEMVAEVMDNGVTLLSEAEATQKEIVVKTPVIRISEKMWGKEGSSDREIIQQLLGKIVSRGNTLTEKIKSISDFLESPPQTEDVSEILTNIILLDTLTNIMVHFNASAAGFTFEGFLSALLDGFQVPAGTAGIQDLIDGDENPVSLKLLTDKPGNVHGSYRDLVDHFIDPGGLKQDRESGQFVGQAGGEGKMTYVVALKSFREKDAAQALAGTEYIRFYQFDFTAQTFFESLMSDKKNVKLLLLPQDMGQPPEQQTQDETYNPIPDDVLKTLVAGRNNGYDPGTAWAYKAILQNYDSEYAMEILADADVVPHPDNPEKNKKMVLVNPDGEPITYKKLPTGDSRWKKVGKQTYQGYLDYKESVNILRDALVESPEKFWGLIARTSGYEGNAGETQFNIHANYYRGKFYNQDGFGYVGQISVGKGAVNDLAQKYAATLNQQIFDLFEKVETLSNQINAYFVAGDKGQGMAAAQTAKQISAETEEYMDTEK